MYTIIPSKYTQLLWRDEIGDSFLILKYAEIYRYSDKLLKMVIWSAQKATQLRKMGVVLYEDETDDGLYLFDISIKNLDKVVALGTFKCRPYKNGHGLKIKKKKLAHRILPFNPKMDKV